MSLHPPHLVDSSGSLTPAALIPFCAYQTNMTILSQTLPDLSFKVDRHFCSKFKPIVLCGQLCYSLEVSMLDVENSKSGLKNGLLLIVDPGKTDFVNNKEKTTDQDHYGLLNLEPLRETEGPASIYINTLAGFTDFRAGSYAMTGLKKTTGTKSFLNLPDEIKGCQNEMYEDCIAQRYIIKAQQKCGCFPWALSRAGTYKVVKVYYIHLSRTTFNQVSPYCSPNASVCLTSISTNDLGCRGSCSGLYADIAYTDDAPKVLTYRERTRKEIMALASSEFQTLKQPNNLSLFI